MMRRQVYIALTLALLTVGVFSPVLNCDFVNYDDPDYIAENPIVQKGLTPQSIAWAFGNVHGEATYWHPLTWLTHELDCQLFGLNPRGHHLDNLLFHTLNVLLLFTVFCRATGAVWPSAFVAAMFALHPLQVDSVAWITERKNLLSTFFMMLSLFAYVRYAERPTFARYAWVFVFFLAALMSKPAVVTFPCLLVLIDFWPLRRIEMFGPVPKEPGARAHEVVSIRRVVLEKIPLLGLSLASSAVTLLAHQGLGMIDASARITFPLRVENAIVSYARYIGKTIWPTHLAVLYPHPGAWPMVFVAVCGVFLLVVTALVLRRSKVQPYLFTGWFWFLGMLVPTIGIVQVGAQAMADRFAYVPIVGLFLMLAWSAANFAGTVPWRRHVVLGAGILVVASCIGVTSRQLTFWKNSVALWEHALRVTSGSYIAHHDLAVALRERGEFAHSRSEFEKALALHDNAQSHLEFGYLFELQHDTNAAISQLEAAVRLSPNWTRAHERLAWLFSRTKNAEGALKEYAQVLKVTPNRPDIHTRMALLLVAEKRVDEAIVHCREALRLKRDDLLALNNLAWILCTNPDPQFRNGAEAVELATRACTLTGWKSPTPLATMAAAHAETGNFQQAAGLAQQARYFALRAGDTNAVSEYEKLYSIIASGKPYREEQPAPLRNGSAR